MHTLIMNTNDVIIMSLSIQLHKLLSRKSVVDIILYSLKLCNAKRITTLT